MPSYQRRNPRRRRRSGTLAAPGAAPEGDSAPERQFLPSQEVTVSAGGQEAVSFRGKGGAQFGVDRMTFGGDLGGLLASAATEGGDLRLFAPVHLSALRALFLRQRLKGLLKVKASNELAVTIHNPTQTEKTVIVQLAGYTGTADVERQEECLRAEHAPQAGAAPRPKLTVARETIPAEATEREIDVPGRSYPIRFKRFFVGSGAELSSLKVSLKLFGGDVVLSPVYASQLEDAFRLEATRAWLVEQSTPLKLAVTNESGAEADVSVLFESYRQPTAGDE